MKQAWPKPDICFVFVFLLNMNSTTVSGNTWKHWGEKQSLKCHHCRHGVWIRRQLELINGPEMSMGLFLIPFMRMLFLVYTCPLYFIMNSSVSVCMPPIHIFMSNCLEHIICPIWIMYLCNSLHQLTIFIWDANGRISAKNSQRFCPPQPPPPQRHRISSGENKIILGLLWIISKDFVLRAYSADFTQFGEQKTEVSLHILLVLSEHTKSDPLTSQMTLDFTCNLVLVSGLGFHGYRLQFSANPIWDSTSC